MARLAGSNGAKTAERARSAALQLFAEQGYAAVSMRQIAGKVGIQASALYNHFPAKQDILLDLLQSHMEALIEAWHEQLSNLQGLDATNKLAEFVRFHIGYHIHRSDEVFLSYMELRNLEDENFSRIEALRKRYESFLKDILQEGKNADEFSVTDVHVTAMAIISMLAGLNNWFRESGRLGVEEIEAIYVRLIAGSVGATLSQVTKFNTGEGQAKNPVRKFAV